MSWPLGANFYRSHCSASQIVARDCNWAFRKLMLQAGFLGWLLQMIGLVSWAGCFRLQVQFLFMYVLVIVYFYQSLHMFMTQDNLLSTSYEFIFVVLSNTMNCILSSLQVICEMLEIQRFRDLDIQLSNGNNQSKFQAYVSQEL